MRSTKMTSTWVASDSMNQPVWNSASSAWNTSSNSPKVRKSKTELTGPITSMKLRMKRMSQCSGFLVISLSTSSSGIGISETAYREVVEQYLHRKHRQERQDQRRSSHREHVSEIRAHRHHDELHDVAEGAAPFADPALQHAEILLQQNYVGRVLGDIDRAIDRDADSAVCSDGASLMPSPR